VRKVSLPCFLQTQATRSGSNGRVTSLKPSHRTRIILQKHPCQYSHSVTGVQPNLSIPCRTRRPEPSPCHCRGIARDGRESYSPTTPNSRPWSSPSPSGRSVVPSASMDMDGLVDKINQDEHDIGCTSGKKVS
jgi:hypothetical protein